MPGFIHDKLEIKFLILYIAARVSEPLPLEGMQELTMCDDGIDYSDFAECLSDLVRTEHLTLSADGLYAITDKGLRNSRICESSLPYSVRLRCDKNLAACNRHLRRKSQVKASTEKRPNGTYTVRLELSDDMGSVMDLRLAIPREDMAAMLTERFQKSPDPDVLRAGGRGPVRRGGEGAPSPGRRVPAPRPVGPFWEIRRDSLASDCMELDARRGLPPSGRSAVPLAAAPLAARLAADSGSGSFGPDPFPLGQHNPHPRQ